MNDPVALVLALAQDAADCGDDKCGDHDPPIAVAVALTAEIARLRRDREDEAWFMQKDIARLRRIEEAARDTVDVFLRLPASLAMRHAAALDALRAALGEKP